MALLAAEPAIGPVNTRYRSRLLPRENWEDDSLFNLTMKAIRTAVEGGFENNFYFHGTLASPTEQVAGVSDSGGHLSPRVWSPIIITS